MLMGYVLTSCVFDIKLQVYNLTAWAAFFAMIAVLFFCHNDVAFNATRLKSAFYMGLLRPAWALCLCWLTYACINGHAGEFLLVILRFESFINSASEN